MKSDVENISNLPLVAQHIGRVKDILDNGKICNKEESRTFAIMKPTDGPFCRYGDSMNLSY